MDSLKWIVVVNLSNSQFEEENIRFTTVPLKPKSGKKRRFSRETTFENNESKKTCDI